MRAGKLFKEFTIEQRAEVVNNYSESEPSWSTLTTTYGEFMNMSGTEIIQANQVDAFYNTKIIIRWIEALRANMRIVYKSRYYNIVSIDDINERDETMIILCKREESLTNG